MEKCNECGREFGTPQALGSHLGQSHNGNPTVECNTCGESFTKVLSRVKKHDRHFCSDSCRVEWFKNNNEQTVRGKVNYSCSICGTDVSRWPSQVQEFVCCSEECHGKLMGRLFSGEDNHNWKENFTPDYGNRWDEIREDVIERDSNKCRICGMDRTFVVVDLHVHHLKPLRSFNDIEKANKKSNLITLCNGCHATVENLNLSRSEVLYSAEQGNLASFM